MSIAPAVIVRGLADARAVLAASAGLPVLLLSPPEAVTVLGPAWWVAMVAAAREGGPEAAMALDVLDCGALAGPAQQALSLGAGGVVFSGGAAQAARLASIAGRRGALLLRSPPPALDMGAYGAARRLALWIGAAT